MVRQKIKKGIALFFVLMVGMAAAGTGVEAKGLSAHISARTVRVGRQIHIKGVSDAAYKSTDTSVASVDPDGTVTGKKSGKCKIQVSKKGFTSKSFTISVRSNPGNPRTLPVTVSEVSLKGDVLNSIRVHNGSRSGTIRRIECKYLVKERAGTTTPVVETSNTEHASVQKTVTLAAQNIAPGKSKVMEITDGKDLSRQNQIFHIQLEKICLYAGDALQVYDAVKRTYSFGWGTKDTQSPQIKGLLKGKSVTGHNDAYRVYYSDRKNTYNFAKGVSATDNRDGKVKVTADDSKVNWKKTGMYRLYFRATDKAGNQSVSWAKVQVIVPGTAESVADQVLRSITRQGWSDVKKARAIYTYIRSHSAYVNNSAHKHWRDSGTSGLRYQSGDCYTYYAMSRLLLTRAGIPNVMINRYPTPGGRRHYWNLAYVAGGWYHFDTTPRTRNERFCLWTDSQLWAYSSGYTFRFKNSLYPGRAKKRI